MTRTASPSLKTPQREHKMCLSPLKMFTSLFSVATLWAVNCITKVLRKRLCSNTAFWWLSSLQAAHHVHSFSPCVFCLIRMPETWQVLHRYLAPWLLWCTVSGMDYSFMARTCWGVKLQQGCLHKCTRTQNIWKACVHMCRNVGSSEKNVLAFGVSPPSLEIIYI